MAMKILTVIVPSNPIATIQIRVPGQQGAGGVPGPTGPSSVISMGTVTTGVPGSPASATFSGVSPNQRLNLTIPRGNSGDPGPLSSLAIGTITTGVPGANGAASITGTAPNFVLNLTLPRGYGVPVGGSSKQVLTKNSTTDYDTGWLSYTELATASTLVSRDSSSNFSINLITGNAAPTAASHLTRKDYVDAQTASKANSVHTHTASQISDSTTVGRALISAVDVTTGRAAIGAGTSNLTLGATNTTAKSGDYQPTSTNITDSTVVGRALITASDPASGRSTIGAGTASTKTDVGLGNVDNTSDVNKPVSTAQAAAISAGTGGDTTAAANTLAKRGAAGTLIAATATQTTELTTLAQVTTITSSFGRDRGSGSALPSTDLRRGDLYYHVNWACLFEYNGTSWRQNETPVFNTYSLRNNYTTAYLSSIYAGFRIYMAADGGEQVWNGTFWNPVHKIPTIRQYRATGTTYNTTAYLPIPYDALDATQTHNPDEEWFTPIPGVNNRYVTIKRAGLYNCHIEAVGSTGVGARLWLYDAAANLIETMASAGGNNYTGPAINVNRRIAANQKVGGAMSNTASDVADGTNGFRNHLIITRLSD